MLDRLGQTALSSCLSPKYAEFTRLTCITCLGYSADPSPLRLPEGMNLKWPATIENDMVYGLGSLLHFKLHR